MLARLADHLESWSEDARDWCDGRSPWLRAALSAYLGYAGARHLRDPNYQTWFAGITLAFHEMGHIVFIPFGQTMTVLGGSVMPPTPHRGALRAGLLPTWYRRVPIANLAQMA